MNYLKVKPASDQIRTSNRGFLIANELYTFKEAQKMKLSKEFISAHFEFLTTSKNNTYFFFGARFVKS